LGIAVGLRVRRAGDGVDHDDSGADQISRSRSGKTVTTLGKIGKGSAQILEVESHLEPQSLSVST
jgi:hypothetical protein